MARDHIASLSPARIRPFLLGVASISIAVVAITLCVNGVGVVNLDELLESPVSFLARLVMPTVLAAVTLSLLLLPRVLVVNLAVLAALVGVADITAALLIPARPVVNGEPEPAQGGDFYVRHATLGYALAPSTVARHRRTVDATVEYDVVYETDAVGRRDTPTTGAGSRPSFLLMFGDSNTFGEGLSQASTLPYYAGELAPGYRAYNYGVPGYGPQHALALADTRRFANEVAEGEGYAVFFVIPAHVARAIGSSTVSTGWGRHFPYYRLGPDGALRHAGDFVHGRPLTTLGYYAWSRTSMASALAIDLPPRYSDDDYRVTARILAETGRHLARRVRLQGFVVMLGQAYNDAQVDVLDKLRDALLRDGVRVLDYSRLLDPRDLAYRISEFDGHNSAKANRALAARLVADLGIGQ